MQPEEAGEGDSDSDFQPDKVEQPADIQIWNDEEEMICEGQNEEEGEEDQTENVVASDSENVLSQPEAKSAKLSQASVASSQIVTRKKRQVVRSDPSSQTSKKEQVIAKPVQKKKDKKVARFFDEEAELGSENEENDDIRKQINKDDIEENEEGLDSDLEGFVEKGDNEIIGEAEEYMMDKFQRDLAEDDRKRTREMMYATIHGFKGKKRRRDEVEGLEDLDADELKKIKAQRLAERQRKLAGEQNEINSQNESDYENDLREGQTKIAREK